MSFFHQLFLWTLQEIMCNFNVSYRHCTTGITMRYYRFFLSTTFIGICFLQTTYAMDLSKHENENNDVAIKMSHFWSDDYSRNIQSIKDVDLKSMRLHLKKENYLSPHANALDHLLYLSTIQKNNTVKTLFTHKQQDKFDTAFAIRRSVPWFFGINGAVIALTSLFPLTNFVGLLQCANTTQSGCLSQASTTTIQTTVSIAGCLAVGFISLYATGLSPDLSSRKANQVQDEIGHLSHKYATIAKYLIDMYFECPQQARYIADRFDIEELKKRAKLKVYKNKAGSALVTPLEEAWHFIKYDTILEKFTEIENYIYNKRNCEKIVQLSERIEFLEAMVREKSAVIEKCGQTEI